MYPCILQLIGAHSWCQRRGGAMGIGTAAREMIKEGFICAGAMDSKIIDEMFKEQKFSFVKQSQKIFKEVLSKCAFKNPHDVVYFNCECILFCFLLLRLTISTTFVFFYRQ